MTFSSLHSSKRGMVGAVAVLPLALLLFAVGAAPAATAAEAPVGLGLVSDYAVLGGETVTNEGLSVVTGNVGVSPGSAITGFPPGVVLDGVLHAADTESAAARAAFNTAYSDAAGRTPVEVGITDLVGRSLVAGVYAGGALGLSGTVTLVGDASSVFIFQASTSLITSSASVVALDGVSACNVFWVVGSSATIGSGSAFAGTVLAAASITANSGTTVNGRLLAGSGQVELHDNVVTRPGECAPSTAAAQAAEAAEVAAAAAAAAQASADAAQAAADQAAADAESAAAAAAEQAAAQASAAQALVAAAAAQAAADAAAIAAEQAADAAEAAATAAQQAATAAAEADQATAEAAAVTAQTEADAAVARAAEAAAAAQQADEAAATARAAAAAAVAAAAARLPATGQDPGPLIGAVLLLSMAGFALVVVHRRMRHH